MNLKDKLVPFLSMISTFLLIGSIGATYAWYQYNTYVNMQLNGTSIGNSKIFDIGVVSDVPLVDYEDYGFTLDSNHDNIYWASGGLENRMVNYYLQCNGYSTNNLNGVTSGKYVTGGDFSLKRAPTHQDNYLTRVGSNTYYDAASKSNYNHLDLVFRLSEVDMSTGDLTVLTDQAIYNSSIELNSDGNLANAIRVHYSSDLVDFIFNPSSDGNGYDTVGGILDLNHDGFYDFKNAYEYVYGEYETLDYNSSATVDGEDSATFQDTFNAVHRNGNRAINESSTVFSTSEFKGYNEVVTNTKTLTVVDSEGYGYLSMDVYLEGWDKVFTDEEQNHAFSLSLDFEAHDNV